MELSFPTTIHELQDLALPGENETAETCDCICDIYICAMVSSEPVETSQPKASNCVEVWNSGKPIC